MLNRIWGSFRNDVARRDVGAIALICSVLLAGSVSNLLPLGLVEVLGFTAGALCVWLTVRESIWNWPVGLASVVFFGVLFWDARLYADMGLQVIYFILGVLGWHLWLHGGRSSTGLEVSRSPRWLLLALVPIVALATAALAAFLVSVNDSAPFLDALTTVLSLTAQFLLTRKYIENWVFWVGADVIYISLYTNRGLYLTAILYAIFLLMCVAGLRQWRSAMRRTTGQLVVRAPGRE